MDELRGLEASMPAISRKKADSPIKRLEGCARTLGLEPTKSSFGIRPSHLERSVPLHGDVLLLVLDQLLSDSDKVALASVSRGVLTEQRALRPSTTQRVRISLDTLVSARAAGWCVSHCHVDKRSGSWVTSGQSDDALADLRTLSVVGRPDCALLVLSPLTDLHAMRQLHTFELDSCAIGDAGVAVLAAAFRNGALQTLQVLDLRRNQVCARACPPPQPVFLATHYMAMAVSPGP